MPDNIDPNVTASAVTSTDGGPPLGAGGGAPPMDTGDEAAVPSPAAARPESKVVTVPTSAMRRIKEEEYARGKQSALDELSSGAGFKSSADFIAALQKLNAPAQAPTPAPQRAQPQQAPQGAEDETDPASQLMNDKAERREAGKYQRQLEKTLNERNRYAAQAQQWQVRAKEAQAEADAVRAEMHLRTIAASVGVQDIDYAITLFSREVERLTPEEANTFDERVYFEGLRKTKPMLFGETVVPATTGTGTGGAPTPPKPGHVAATNGANGKFDGRKATPQQLAEELKRRGITSYGA